MLGVIGTILAMGAIASYADKDSRRAYPAMDDKKTRAEIDAEFARYGIKGQDGKFTETKINIIAARNHVRPNKYGVLPENGWLKCQRYVFEYANCDEDIDDFKRAWYDTVEHQLEMQRKQISDPKLNKKVRDYHDSEKYVKRTLKQRETGPTIVLEYKHWHGIPKEEQLQRMKELQEKTIWGQICKEKPILRHNSRYENTYKEVWIIKGKNNDRQESWGTKQYYKNLYTECCAKIGYNAEL